MAKTKQTGETGEVNCKDFEPMYAGNFVMKVPPPVDVECRYGHETRLFNIGRNHFVACDKCRTWMWAGNNVFSDWRYENEGLWQKNRESIKDYREVR